MHMQVPYGFSLSLRMRFPFGHEFVHPLMKVNNQCWDILYTCRVEREERAEGEVCAIDK